jgi:hypothetical protein
VRYIVAHWRGELGIVQSSPLNGVALFLVLALMGVFIVPATIIGLLGSASALWTIVFGLLGFFVLCMGWSIVGIFRCGLRYSFDEGNGLAHRIFGSAVAVAALVVSVFLVSGIAAMVNDFNNLAY